MRKVTGPWSQVQPADELNPTREAVLSDEVWNAALRQVEEQITDAASALNLNGDSSKYIPDIV
jgi:hypothetical protein